MADMTKRARLEATIRGEPVDRPAVALWRHFPGDDQDPVQLARSVTAFQKEYDFDFVKVTPASSYSVQGWGAQDRWTGNPEGTRDYILYPVERPEDWRALPRLDPESGVLGQQLHCLEAIREALGPKVPVIETIFSPLTQAKNLAGRTTLLSHLREYPDALREGLETIAATTAGFVQAARLRGIDGIFLAVQHASYEVLSRAEYEEFGVPFDRKILDAADGLWLNVLHLHGSRVMFDLLADYPVQVVNWHDRETPPSLAEGQQLVRGAVLGGLRQLETLLRGTPEDVRREARDAIEQTEGRRFILGTGCVVPVTAPWSNLRAAREIVAAQSQQGH